MRSNIKINLARNAKKIAIFLPVMLSITSAHAEDFTAGVVMNKMTSEQRFSFFAGVVEGLAFARYTKDGKKTEGMECIYGWFYGKKETLKTIHDTFDKYPDHMPGPLMEALIEKECGA